MPNLNPIFGWQNRISYAKPQSNFWLAKSDFLCQASIRFLVGKIGFLMPSLNRVHFCFPAIPINEYSEFRN
jgi:hypothetical protein